jgi:hypothetical protein
MDATKINFCNSNGFVISNDRTKSDIVNSINDKFKTNIYNSDIRIYNDYVLDALKKNRYLICCLITNARPYIMYFTKLLNENVCLLIDLKIRNNCTPNIIAIPVSLDYETFSETIIYGDLFKNTKNYKWEFMVEKCLVYKNRPVNLNNQMRNLTMCNDVLSGIHPNILTPFDIRLKDFTVISKLPELFKKYNKQTVGIKIYGLKTPIVYYLNKKYIPQTRFSSVKLLEYKKPTSLSEDIRKIEQSFIVTSKHENDDSHIWDYIIDNDVDIEQEFTLTLKKTDTYGIYHLFSDETFVGIGRITTIELHNNIFKLFKNKSKIKVSAFYNYNFNKWNIESIIDFQNIDESVKNITKHINLVSQLSKAAYVVENC